MLSKHACVFDLLDLSCTTSKILYIKRADYGEYANCNSGCCDPDKKDCIVDVEKVSVHKDK